MMSVHLFNRHEIALFQQMLFWYLTVWHDTMKFACEITTHPHTDKISGNRTTEEAKIASAET